MVEQAAAARARARASRTRRRERLPYEPRIAAQTRARARPGAAETLSRLGGPYLPSYVPWGMLIMMILWLHADRSRKTSWIARQGLASLRIIMIYLARVFTYFHPTYRDVFSPEALANVPVVFQLLIDCKYENYALPFTQPLRSHNMAFTLSTCSLRTSPYFLPDLSIYFCISLIF